MQVNHFVIKHRRKLITFCSSGLNCFQETFKILL